MRSTNSIPTKIYKLEALVQEVTRWRLKNKTIAFTNGVFDMLHEGHVASLTEAAQEADVLIVGVNSDASVKRLKGPLRPVINEGARSLLLASLLITDAVILFDTDTPLELIKAIMPDVLVKGGDYSVDQIAGAKEVIDNGGRVRLAEIVPGISTTSIIERMKK